MDDKVETDFFFLLVLLTLAVLLGVLALVVLLGVLPLVVFP